MRSIKYAIVMMCEIGGIRTSALLNLNRTNHHKTESAASYIVNTYATWNRMAQTTNSPSYRHPSNSFPKKFPTVGGISLYAPNNPPPTNPSTSAFSYPFTPQTSPPPPPSHTPLLARPPNLPTIIRQNNRHTSLQPGFNLLVYGSECLGCGFRSRGMFLG